MQECIKEGDFFIIRKKISQDKAKKISTMNIFKKREEEEAKQT